MKNWNWLNKNLLNKFGAGLSGGSNLSLFGRLLLPIKNIGIAMTRTSLFRGYSKASNIILMRNS
ncbi:MAG: hypothetical protein D8M61_17505 [Ignavibacteriae bacterium]|nr:hypothetical protein [Ignavibacteriota bacterium]